MSKRNKWMIAAAVLLVLGLILCAVAYWMLGSDFKKLSTVKYETRTFEVKEDFRKIRIDVDEEDVTFARSEDGICKVVCREEASEQRQVSVQGDTLTIERKEQHDKLNFGVITETPGITVYLPGKEYESLKIDCDTGDVVLPGTLSFDRGISIDSDTGDIVLTKVTSSGRFHLKTNTGDIVLTACDADTMVLETDTGDITGTLLSGKIFLVESDLGDVDVPKTTAGGTCEISTDTGDISIKIVSN